MCLHQLTVPSASWPFGLGQVGPLLDPGMMDETGIYRELWWVDYICSSKLWSKGQRDKKLRIGIRSGGYTPIGNWGSG